VLALLVGVGGNKRSARDPAGQVINGPDFPFAVTALPARLRLRRLPFTSFMKDNTVDMSIHSETTSLLREMELVYQSITSYQPAITKPPILDSSFDTAVDRNSQHLHGLRPFLEAAKRDIDVVKQVPLPPPSDWPCE
jgi:hypothetical protein